MHNYEQEIVAMSAINETITELQSQIQKLEEDARQVKQTVNVLCTRTGRPPIYPDAEASDAGISQIVGDTFFGKKLNTAIKHYMGMRKAASQGSASVREIFEALKKGGFEFVKNEGSALRGLRATLSKSTHTFRRVPTGEYGLAEWYPHAKNEKEKSSNDSQGAGDSEPVEATDAEINEAEEEQS